MAQKIAASNNPHHVFLTTLSGHQIQVTMRWQPLDRYWYISLREPSGAILCRNLRLTGMGRPLRGAAPTHGGEIYVIGPGDPGREAWDNTHTLWWATEDEIEAYEAAMR